MDEAIDRRIILGRAMVKKAAEAIPNHRLRAARKERGWTQREVADGIGAPSPLNITRWELGMAFPSSFYIRKLCQFFHLSVDELGLLRGTASRGEALTRPDASFQHHQSSRGEHVRPQDSYPSLPVPPTPLLG